MRRSGTACVGGKESIHRYHYKAGSVSRFCNSSVKLPGALLEARWFVIELVDQDGLWMWHWLGKLRLRLICVRYGHIVQISASFMRVRPLSFSLHVFSLQSFSRE